MRSNFGYFSRPVKVRSCLISKPVVLKTHLLAHGDKEQSLLFALKLHKVLHCTEPRFQINEQIVRLALLRRSRRPNVKEGVG